MPTQDAHPFLGEVKTNNHYYRILSWSTMPLIEQVQWHDEPVFITAKAVQRYRYSFYSVQDRKIVVEERIAPLETKLSQIVLQGFFSEPRSAQAVAMGYYERALKVQLKNHEIISHLSKEQGDLLSMDELVLLARERQLIF